MLKIRKEQMAILSAYVRAQFEDRMVIQLSKCFPQQCTEMGEKMLREFIQKGINVTAEYGIDLNYDVARYICLMFFLGPDFNLDPRFPWAAEILKDKTVHPTLRVNRLEEHAEKAIGQMASQVTPMEG